MTETVAPPASTAERLGGIVANRAWLHRAYPFPHVVAREVFAAEFYDELAAQLKGILDRGLSEVHTDDRFARGMPGYDAYGISITPALEYPLTLFLSRAWRDLMCGLFAIGPTPYVFAGAHYHAPWSADGFVHTDFNPLWFPRAADDEIQIPDPERCAFKTGEGPLETADKVETVRGAVVIFYLLNGGWGRGDGGETGLFTSRGDPLSEPAARCPPENNSLVAFECTPRSFHAFLANKGRPRTSIIMWVHRDLDEASDRLGAEHIERWKV
jgi:2OG-Fe(II) oxygenase superfamily